MRRLRHGLLVGVHAGGKYPPEYRAWCRIKKDCLNPNSKDYEDYGGRGITVCDRWINSFEAFYADMGPRPMGYSIDRVDNDLGYSPENCRWATLVEQNNNRRNNRLLTLDGITQTVAQWARFTGLGEGTIRERLRRGWSDAGALAPELRPKVAYCKYGHLLDASNTYIRPDNGHRQCRACRVHPPDNAPRTPAWSQG